MNLLYRNTNNFQLEVHTTALRQCTISFPAQTEIRKNFQRYWYQNVDRVAK